MRRKDNRRRSKQIGVAYFVRRSSGGCSVIALYADDREEVVGGDLAPGEAEDFCATRIEAMRTAEPPLVTHLRRAVGSKAVLGESSGGLLLFWTSRGGRPGWYRDSPDAS